jgi:hypothetical protein
VVGDGNTMGVGAEISQGVLGAAEGTLGIDHPVLAEQGPQPRCKGARFGQMQQTAVERKCTGRSASAAWRLSVATKPTGFQPVVA